jgi:hypothetical protein
MSKGTLNLTIVNGDSFDLPITMTDNQTIPVAINLTSATITSDIKRNIKSSLADLSFTVTKTNAAAGQFTLSLTAIQTATLKATKDDESNIYYYDVEFDYGGGDIKTEFGGSITVVQQVTI